MRCRLMLAGLLCCLWLPATAAGELRLEGKQEQGGLLQGQTAPGSAVTLDGRPVRVDGQGRFIIGFGRDAAPAARLEVTGPDGGTHSQNLEIALRTYQVQRIDGLPSKKVTPPEEVYARIQAENAKIAQVRQIDTPEAPFLDSGFQWPAVGIVTGVYGSQRVLNGIPKRPHYGIDIAAAEGTPILAPAAGTVTLAEEDLYYTGGTIILDHGHGLSSAFLHLKDVNVAVGDQVDQGQQIGTLGGTGRATGPHLDWRVNWFEVRIDPAYLLGPMPAAAQN